MARGLDVDCRSGAGSSALHFAVMSRNADVVRFLLEHGADVNATCGKADGPCSDQSPLHMAAQEGEHAGVSDRIAYMFSCTQGFQMRNKRPCFLLRPLSMTDVLLSSTISPMSKLPPVQASWRSCSYC